MLGNPILALPPSEALLTGPGLNIAYVSTFAPNEPLEAVVQVANELPQVHDYNIGDTNRNPKSFHDSLPDNITCMGFLPDNQYIGYLRTVDSILVLTSRDHTLQLGGCEAV